MVKPSTLQKYSVFNGMMEEQIESIFPFMHCEKYNPDEVIIIEGKPNEKIYFIIEGHVSVTKRGVTLASFGEGETFGEMEVLDVTPAIATIKSISAVTVMTISNKSLRDIYKSDISIFSLIIMNLARDLVRRLRKTDEKLASTQLI